MHNHTEVQMANNEGEFLRNQVSRLSHLLSRYQEAYPNFVLDEHDIQQGTGDGHAPWLSEEQLSPLLKEYDGIIYGLQDQNQKLLGEINNLKRQASDLVTENESLRRDLRETVEARLGGVGIGGGDDAILSNLQEQVDQAVQEKDAAQEKWREAAQEVDRLEAELEMEKESHQFQVVEKQAHQVKDQYQQSVTALSGEMEALQKEIRECRADNGDKIQKITELKIRVSDLQQQLVWKDQEIADNIFKEGFADSKNSELKRIMEDLRQRLNVISKESEELRRENTSLLTRSTELQRRLLETEARENDAIVQVRDSVQMVEAAVLEKDQMEILARQKEEEVEEMRGMMSRLINKAGARTREEVDNVRKQCNERISQLTEELHALEMQGTEKQARLDRLIREKRSVESELQQIYKEGMAEGSKSKEAYQELNKRAIDAERGRDEASIKVDSLQGELERLKLENNRLAEQLTSETKQLQERLSTVQSEFESVDEDRIACADKLNEMEKKLLQATQEKEAAYRKFTKELALVEQEQQTRTRNLEIKLQTTEDTKSQTVGELRKLLTSQQRMSARWKEECQTITHKFECKLEDMRGELSHVKKRNEDLTSLLKQSQAKTAEAQHMISDYTKHIQRMEERVREAEIQAGEASKKLSRQSMRERQMANERESLLADLARSQQRAKDTASPVGTFGSKRGEMSLDHSRRGEKLTIEHLNGSTNGKMHLQSSGCVTDER